MYNTNQLNRQEFSCLKRSRRSWLRYLGTAGLAAGLFDTFRSAQADPGRTSCTGPRDFISPDLLPGGAYDQFVSMQAAERVLAIKNSILTVTDEQRL